MRKPLNRLVPAAVTIGALSILLTACGAAGSSPEAPKAGEAVTDPAALEYEKPDFNDIPDPNAASCEGRVINTSEGPVTLKNADIVDGAVNFYFAPSASVYNSYTFEVSHDSGSFHVEDISAGQHQAYTVNSDGTREPHYIGLGSALHSYNFKVPRSANLGAIKWVSAAVNGEHAGTCYLS